MIVLVLVKFYFVVKHCLLVLMFDGSDSGIRASQTPLNSEVNLCTCGAPIPEEAMMCSNCVLSARYSLDSAQTAAYEDGMSAGASEHP